MLCHIVDVVKRAWVCVRVSWPLYSTKRINTWGKKDCSSKVIQQSVGACSVF